MHGRTGRTRAAALLAAALTFSTPVFSGDPPPAAQLRAPYASAKSASEVLAPSMYGPSETLPIDLPTVIRLVNENSPLVGVARARFQEALARQDRAELLYLPNLAGGLTYYRLDGQTQNQRGDIFNVSRSTLFAGGGPQLRLDLADAFFQPLVARRLTDAAGLDAQATTLRAQYDAVSAYFDMVLATTQLLINADTLARAEQMLKYAKTADAVGQSKTKADVHRAQTEVHLRRQERLDLIGRAGAASARLGRLLLLNPTVDLVPADAVVPVVVVPGACTLEDLIAMARTNRPDLAAQRVLVAASAERVRQARLSPYIPKVTLDYSLGAFGGGRGDFIGQFDGRGVLGAQVYWEVQNLGFGNAAQVRERQAGQLASHYQLIDAESRAAAEVTEAAKLASARFGTLDDAQKAVKEAIEMYRILQESSFNMVGGPQARYDSLEPLLAIQALNTARTQYLTEVVEFNRAQFRLYTAIGHPPEAALKSQATVPIEVPLAPIASVLPDPKRPPIPPKQ